jgi:uncharacterized protein with PIN domain
MTPDEVVNGLLNLRKEVLGIDETAKNKFSIYNSAISLIQDYQKLRERVSVEKIEKETEFAGDFILVRIEKKCPHCRETGLELYDGAGEPIPEYDITKFEKCKICEGCKRVYESLFNVTRIIITPKQS